MDNLLLVLIPVVITSFASLGVALLTYRSNRKDIQRQEKADAMAIYSTLIDDLREMIDLNNQEISRLRQEYQDLKSRFDCEREEWAAERSALVSRITELERLNAKLEAKIDELEAKSCGAE